MSSVGSTTYMNTLDVDLTEVIKRLSVNANIENVSLENVSNIDLVALIYDETGSIFAASKTFIDTLPVGGSVPVVFTWPEVFSHQALNTEIIVRIFPDRSFIR